MRGLQGMSLQQSGAYMNVLINLKDIYDDSYRVKVLNKANKILKEVR